MSALAIYDADLANRQQLDAIRRLSASQGDPAEPQRRFAASAPLDWLSGMFSFGKGAAPAAEGAAGKAAWNAWNASRLAKIGGIGAGGLAIGGLMSAVGELGNQDPTVTNAQKLGGAAAAGAGSIGLGAAGAVLGGMTPLGPLGALIGGSLGSALGGQLGGAGRAAVGVFGPSELDKQIAAYQRTAQAQADAKAYEMQTLLPIQKQVADAVLANQIKGAAAMAPIEAQRLRNQTLYQGLLAGQQQQAQLANTALSGLYSGGFI